MDFYLAFHFFIVFFDFAFLPKAAFCKDKEHRGTFKGGKMSLLFFSNQMHIFMHFYVPFIIFKVPFDFSAVSKPAFCMAKVHRGTPKREKMSLLFFSNRGVFFLAFLPVFLFFQSPFRFCLPSKTSILEEKSALGYLQTRKNVISFFL